jgi:hypothetical protein
MKWANLSISLMQFDKRLSPETRKPPTLTAFQCAQIGLLALEREYYFHAIEWIEVAMHKVSEEYDESIIYSALQSYLQLAVRVVGC